MSGEVAGEERNQNRNNKSRISKHVGSVLLEYARIKKSRGLNKWERDHATRLILSLLHEAASSQRPYNLSLSKRTVSENALLL